MSKIIDLTGLATAIQNIKNWVNLQIGSLRTWVQSSIDAKTHTTYLTYTDQEENNVTMIIDGTSETAVDIRNISAYKVKEPLTIVKGSQTSSYDGSSPDQVGFESIVEEQTAVTIDRGETAPGIIAASDFSYSATINTLHIIKDSNNVIIKESSLTNWNVIVPSSMEVLNSATMSATLKYEGIVTIASTVLAKFKIENASTTYRQNTATGLSFTKSLVFFPTTRIFRSPVITSQTYKYYAPYENGDYIYISTETLYSLIKNKPYWPKETGHSETFNVPILCGTCKVQGVTAFSEYLISNESYTCSGGASVSSTIGLIDINNITYFNKGVSFEDEHVQINGVNVAPNVYKIESESVSKGMNIDLKSTYKHVFDYCTSVQHNIWLPDPTECAAGTSIYLHILPNTQGSTLLSRGVYNDDGTASDTGLGMYYWSEGTYTINKTSTDYTKGGFVRAISDGSKWWCTRISESY